MAATKRQMNWQPVAFTPSGGSASTATGVTQVQINMGGTLAKFAGDGDRYNTTVVNSMNDPVVTVHSADVAWLMGIAPGTKGSLSATNKDAQNATGGAITFVLSNAIANSPTWGDSHAQFGTGTVDFHSFSSDGTTSPLATSFA